MDIHILTLFPEAFSSYMSSSIIGRAIDSGTIKLNFIDIRDYSKDKHRKVDDEIFGGGPGMLMQLDPILNALDTVIEEGDIPIVPDPSGQIFTQPAAKRILRECSKIILICGHYEGIDSRLFEIIKCQKFSIGDYILTGGELPAMVMIDAIARLIPGVVQNQESINQESFEQGLLEPDQYTRPSDYKGYKVPDSLLSGNHKAIEQFQRENALINTFKSRPDLLKDLQISQQDFRNLLI